MGVAATGHVQWWRMVPPAIEARGLSKTYRFYDRPSDRLWEAIGRRGRHGELRALEDVSFTLPRGEGLGIIGENGAGKSTLLKLLSGVTQPTAGSFRVSGRVAAILELGSGFHPDFTGRQNAVLNAALLGLSEREVESALPRILEFSELGEFVDRPVKTYSTGMAMRLAFSIATQVDPEVLIVDEALSVGDGYFQKKCLDRMLAYIRGGGTVLFCSHAMYYVSALCRHALWLRNGRVERFGPALEVVEAYEEHLAARAAGAAAASSVAVTAEVPVVERARAATAPAKLLPVRWLDDGKAVREGGRSFRQGEALGLDVTWQSTDPARRFHVAVGVDRADGVQICAFATHQDGLGPLGGSDHQRARLLVPELPLIRGEFSLYVFLLDEEGLHVYDQEVVHGAFRVEAAAYRTGIVALHHAWEATFPETAAPVTPSLAMARVAETTSW
jgi:ABC-type polysaccharide/polyol phosphate transport system ATPase subunit